MTDEALCRSYAIAEWGKPLVRRCTPIPTPTGAEVLVRVEMCGVCHSDLHVWHGPKPGVKGRALPFVLGHEIIGIVEGAGPEAGPVEIGSRRIVFPWIGCGECPACRRGQETRCEATRSLGTKVDGGYATHVVVPRAEYLVDPQGLPADVAATLACSGLTAYSAIRKLPALTSDDWLLIIGAGGVGLAALGIARALTAARIAVADIDPVKRERARELGADRVLDLSADAADAPRVTAVLDFVGSAQTVSGAMPLLMKGATLVVVGLYGGTVTLPIESLPGRSLALVGSLTGSLAELRDLVALAAAGRFRFVPTEQRDFAQINAIMADLEAGRITGRVVAVH